MRKHISAKRKDVIERSIEIIDQELLSSLKNQRINEESRAIENIKTKVTKPKHFSPLLKNTLKQRAQ